MKKFKDLILENSFNLSVDFPSVSVTMDVHTLTIRFNSQDTAIEVGYKGDSNPWLSSLCYLVQGKTLNELSEFSWKNWENIFREDQTFWDCYQDEGNQFIHKSLELLRAALNIYQGRDYLYQEASPLVCRCFGVRERDIIDHLQKENNPSLESLGNVSNAGMGCRSCIFQLKRWLLIKDPNKNNRYFKDRPAAEWLIDIDRMLSSFPKSVDWKMEVAGFKGNQVTILFDKEVSQKEEEIIGKELQDFLARSVDLDLSFFLSRTRHLSKARG